MAAEQLHALAERAARRNLRIGFEALAWGRHVNLWRQAWQIVERADHPHLGLIVDSFHTLSLRDDPAPIADLPGEKIFFLQMADAPMLNMSVIDWARHHRNFPGQGQLDVVGFFDAVVRSGYRGPLSLEIFNDVFRETPNRRVAVDAMRSLLWLEGQVRERLESVAATDVQARQALQREALVAVPPVPAFRGFSFIEFAVDDAGAQPLGALLGQLGFQQAGRHRSKPVTLWRQGGINLVVNTQAHDAARARFDAYGPSVCALGLRVDDPPAALNRATALRSARHEPPTGPGEQQLASIVAPGGSILQFIADALGDDGLWEADFELDNAAIPDAGAGLGRIDHVAMGMSQDQIDTWVLFCRAVLGLDAAEAVKLADPFGLVRSFGMADAGRRLRLVLNVSVGSRTRMAQTLDARGAGVHHIAFASGDIFASVEKLRANGVAFVPISNNYYDDLPTRFELAPEFVERLRGAGVLFDRNDAGDYLHVYTESFAERFFFEVVQRVGGYDAYGALNAPARMASQAQREAIA